DTERGVHKAPANEIIRGLYSDPNDPTAGLQFNITKGQQDILNPRGVNVLRYFPGRGNLVWGARTCSLDPDWKYVNVRRLFIFAEESIDEATQWVVFEPNDEPTWARVRRSVSDFLTRLWMDGMLQGRSAAEAYFVRCDRTTMTQADIDNGKLIMLIGIAPVKPAEFVIFRIGQWTGGSEVSEG
ncbi:MAG TPA: phage tail sheath C-terminal domain-containing protein, partial [Rhodanobacteraceae bacterium]|nr:phage tail sheath C-terminal domain-containing protein [Rhodanobacteraceae bacterium]